VKPVADTASVRNFIEAIDDPQRRCECREVVALMRRITGCRPEMWGDNIIGFDRYRHARANGTEFELFRTGFSPHQSALTFYVIPGYSGYAELLGGLDPQHDGRCCLHLRSLADIDIVMLEEIVRAGLEEMNERHPPP
jgi:hypothetical protein